jgi:hypothetical protein
MSQVLVWKSDADGKLFEDRTKYQKHLRKLAAERRDVKKRDLYRVQREEFLDQMGQVASFDELQQFIIDNWNFFRYNMLEKNTWRKIKHGLPKNDDQLVSLDITGMHFVHDMRNSHSAPRKGVTNFDSRDEYNKGKPTGYAGWRGRITYSVTRSTSFGSDYFNNTPINTGSGGGSDSRLSYDLTLWCADFPVMWAEQAEKNWIEKENRDRAYAWRQIGGSTAGLDVVTEIPADWTVPDPLEATSYHA